MPLARLICVLLPLWLATGAAAGTLGWSEGAVALDRDGISILTPATGEGCARDGPVRGRRPERQTVVICLDGRLLSLPSVARSPLPVMQPVPAPPSAVALMPALLLFAILALRRRSRPG